MKKQLTIGWLYPDLMSTYGDRGNIIALRRRCEWREIEFSVLPINHETNIDDLKKVDMIFGGGSQDREQEIVMRDLRGKKQEIIRNLIEDNVPALFVCGSPQLMGRYYEPAVGLRIEGIGIFDIVTKNPGPDVPRCIGNIVAKVYWENLNPNPYNLTPNFIVGFENHGGRTYLGNNVKPFAKVIKGNGNNGEDGTEGVIYKNAVGCYFHGPFLPKNPSIADYFIKTTLEVKYKKEITLKQLDDSLEYKANQAIVRKLGISY
jgi:lipid II isoglutaminyl synthase (glutamine-hydrolysing)